jgi:hypothetical protein
MSLEYYPTPDDFEGVDIKKKINKNDDVFGPEGILNSTPDNKNMAKYILMSYRLKHFPDMLNVDETINHLRNGVPVISNFYRKDTYNDFFKVTNYYNNIIPFEKDLLHLDFCFSTKYFYKTDQFSICMFDDKIYHSSHYVNNRLSKSNWNLANSNDHQLKKLDKIPLNIGLYVKDVQKDLNLKGFTRYKIVYNSNSKDFKLLDIKPDNFHYGVSLETILEKDKTNKIIKAYKQFKKEEDLGLQLVKVETFPWDDVF